MVISRRRELACLGIGDIVCLILSLGIMLIVRFGDKLDRNVISTHLWPFTILFIVSLLLFYIAGLYEKQTIVFKKKLPQTIINAQIVNAIVAIALFYFVTDFIITPKISLFLYLAISSGLMITWRLSSSKVFDSKKKYSAVVIGKGEAVHELVNELNHNTRYDIFVADVIDPTAAKITIADIKNRVPDVSLVVVDGGSQAVQEVFPELYSMIFSGVRCIDLRELYEDVFNRVPLSLLDYEWFVKYASDQYRPVYSVVKRIADILVALPLGIISLVFYPFVWIGTKLSDGGPLFFSQDRIGKGGKVFRIWKFRSMSDDHKVTRFGSILRKSRIDELPQLWSVIKGDQSLIGPRPEKPDYVAQYDKEIPYYNFRHIISPGLSGWAQIYHDNHPHHAIAQAETREKLSFDLYYIKHRSPGVDISIALKTLKILVTFVGK